MRPAVIANYEDRLALAREYLVLTWERRDEFLSDSDVLDAADAFTTSEELDDNWETADREDHSRLLRDLDKWLEGQS